MLCLLTYCLVDIENYVLVYGLSKHRCLPFYGNVLPRPPIGFSNVEVSTVFSLHYHIMHSIILLKEADEYLWKLHYFITCYSTLLTSNFTIIFCCMAITYYKVFRRIKIMTLTQG